MSFREPARRPMRGSRNMTSSMFRGPVSMRSGPSGISSFSNSCRSVGASRTASIRRFPCRDGRIDTHCRRSREMNAQLMPYGLLTVLFKHKSAVLGIFFAVVLGGIGYLIFAEQKYESVAQLIVRFG